MTNNSLFSFTHNSNIISNFSITPDRRQYTIFLSYLRAQQLVPYLWITLRFWTYWVMGKSEEQLPQKNCRPTVGRQSADCRLPPFTKIFCQQSAECWPNVGRLSANCWQHVGNLLAKCRLRTPVEYQKSLSSQGSTLHIDAKWNFLTWVRHSV